jgi:hypothetical protein
MAAKVMGLLRRSDGLRLRDSSVQPFVLADTGTGYMQQTPIAAPQASRNSGTPASSTARSYGWFCPGLPPGHRGLLLCPRERKLSDATYIPVTRTGGTYGNVSGEGMMNDVSVNFCYHKVMPPGYKWNGPRLELPPRAITANASYKGRFSSVYPIPVVVLPEAGWGLRALRRAASLLAAHSISGSVSVTRPLLLDPRRTLPDRLHSMCPRLPEMFLRIFRARSQEPLHGLAAVAGPAPKQGSRAGTVSYDMDRHLGTTSR